MKKPTLSLLAAFSAAFFSPAPAATIVWTLYKGATIVKPRVAYPTFEACQTAAWKAPGNYKLYHCEATGTIDPPPVPPDHSATGPVINTASIPSPAVGFSTDRVRSIWRHADTGADCLPGSDKCSVPPSLQTSPAVNGAFRVSCLISHYLKDDPIVYPGLPGASHLHAFFGNTSANASSTQATLAVGDSTCSGGTVNRSSYWMPAMVDTLTGNLVRYRDSNFYYKQGYFFPGRLQRPPPAGLRVIAGDAKNTASASASGRFICYVLNDDSQNPGWSNSIGEAVAKGKCLPGAEMIAELAFPNCWDGVNLDSPDHKSHMASSIGDACPASHPVLLVSYSINAHIPIVAGMNPAKWRLSSDAYGSELPGGLSMHADAFWMWKPEIADVWAAKCDGLAPLDCRNDLLGDGRTLY